MNPERVEEALATAERILSQWREDDTVLTDAPTEQEYLVAAALRELQAENEKLQRKLDDLFAVLPPDVQVKAIAAHAPADEAKR